MDPSDEVHGDDEAFAPTGEIRPDETAELGGARPARPPLPPDLAGSGAPRRSYPPLPPDLGGGAVSASAGPPGRDPGAAAAYPAGGAGLPPGGQPPYSPPYGWAWPPGGPGPSEPEPEPPRRRRKGVVVGSAVAGVALLAGGLGAGLGVAFSSSNASSAGSSNAAPVPGLPKSSAAAETSHGSESVASITSSVEPAVVDINVNVASPAGYQQEQAAGTGMIVTSSGEVLTNNHVVEDATSISVSLPHHGRYAAKVIGVDPTEDVALIQIEHAPKDLPYVTLGNSSAVSIGQSVVAIGNAYGLGGSPSVATGTVAALGRTITASDPSPTTSSELLHNLIETSAQIAAGDSGGPLLNSSGQVIGMDTAEESGQGGTLGFAIPINTARTIIEQMEKGRGSSTVLLGASPFLGIEAQPTTGGSGAIGTSPGGFGGLPGFGNSGTAPVVSGVTLYDVIQGSPAQRAGLAQGDTISKVDGTKTATWNSLTKVIDAKKPGERITVTYVDTNGNSHSVQVTLAGLPK